MKATAVRRVSYDPSIFTSVETVDDAMRIIVTPEAGFTSQHRWDVETPYLIELIEPWLRSKSTVLDYGCGIGRLAKPLIEKHSCDVVGVDISPNMLALASSFVNSDRFAATPPGMLRCFKSQFDFAIAVWSLQHALDLPAVVWNIEAALMPGGKFFVVNNIGRAVPTAGGWIDDGVDVQAVLKDRFTEIEHGQLSSDIAPGSFKENTFWAVYQK
jgi:SAM-dependent methyltransferase